MNMRRRMLLLMLSAVAALGAERVYTPSVKPGENPAAVAAERDDWRRNVQDKFTRYSGKPLPVIFDGDSITNRWETTGKPVWTEKFARIAADFGIEGDRTENVLWRLSKGQVDGMDPKVVVLMIGTNNTGRDSVDGIAAGVEKIVNEYLKRCKHARVVLMGIFPREAEPTSPARLKVNAINAKLSQLKSDRVDYVDIGAKLIAADGKITPQMMPDAVHPTLGGYQIWADAIAPFVEDAMKR